MRRGRAGGGDVSSITLAVAVAPRVSRRARVLAYLAGPLLTPPPPARPVPAVASSRRALDRSRLETVSFSYTRVVSNFIVKYNNTTICKCYCVIL